MEVIAKSDGSHFYEEIKDLPPELKGAVIAAAGRISPVWSHVMSERRIKERALEEKNEQQLEKLGDHALSKVGKGKERDVIRLLKVENC